MKIDKIKIGLVKANPNNPYADEKFYLSCMTSENEGKQGRFRKELINNKITLPKLI